ncbi:MAG TPA: hypothetical protein VLA09_07945, partial [Longimicrobiales bacterium]|nr:hypothetical protein [Longimicrobiales bacterium]
MATLQELVGPNESYPNFDLAGGHPFEAGSAGFGRVDAGRLAAAAAVGGRRHRHGPPGTRSHLGRQPEGLQRSARDS